MRISSKGIETLTRHEEADAQFPKRMRNKRLRRRCSTTSSFSLLLFSFLSSFGANGPLHFVHANAASSVSSEEESGGEDAARAHAAEELDPETEALLNDFIHSLYNFSYTSKLVAESNAKKLPAAEASSRGPPVMIGRRRSLLEHNMHHHYSWQFLDRIKSDPTNTNVANNSRKNKKIHSKIKANFQESLKAYLYLSEYEASVKANPQRQQHNAATSNAIGLPNFPPSLKQSNRNVLRNMFYKSYNSYMTHAFPAAELKPMTCQPGTFDLVRLPALTLIDALDTLLVLGDTLEFAKSVERLRHLHQEQKSKSSSGNGGLFAVNQNVSVFETNIRVLGGLLSAHQLAVAFLPDKEAMDNANSNNKLPQVYLSDVFSQPEDPYLQPPEDVERRLEIYMQQQQQHSATQQAEQVPTDQGTCPIWENLPEDDDAQPPSSAESQQNDWWDHCGSGVLALEDCAATSTKINKALNQTAFFQKRALLQQQSRPQWQYDGFLLELALDMGNRLLPAFDTQTGIPYGTVNLLHGVPRGETTIASLAGGGTLSLEMELLSRLTGDLRFGQAAKLAIRALWMRKSNLHLVGKHIDIHSGRWTETLSGIGSNSDSFLEYLLKHYLLFPEEEDFWLMLQSAYSGIFHDSRLGEWYLDVDMKIGKRHFPKGHMKKVFESLMAFYPGMQTLLGEMVPAARSMNSFFMVREYLGFLPERFNYAGWKVDGGVSSGAAKYLLRPELLESSYFMHRATKRESSEMESSSSWLWASDFALHHLERLTRAKCGYASVRGLNPMTGNLNAYQKPDQVKLFNEMPSFFLSETIKYLYLTFDDDNILHMDKDREWIFTTEAHPIHYAPLFEKKQNREESKNKGKESTLLAAVKDKLKQKLNIIKYQKERRRKGYKTPMLAKNQLTTSPGIISPQYLQEESWASNTLPRSYRSALEATVSELKAAESGKNGAAEGQHPLLTFFGDGTNVLVSMQADSTEHWSREEKNLAHITWNSVGLGSGYALKKACPNIYAPELTWVHALNGGSLDYTDVYVSSFSETDSNYPPSSSDALQLLVSSAEALSVHGSGVYLGNMEAELKPDEQCPVPDKTNRKQAKKDKAASQESAASTEKGTAKDKDGSNIGARVELSGMGNFQISAFPEGSGFLMQHVESGESIMATFITEEEVDGNADAADVYIMAYASMPRGNVASASDMGEDSIENNAEFSDVDSNPSDEAKPSSPWKLARLASLFRKKARKDANAEGVGTDEEQSVAEADRAVVVADLQGNSFNCQVNIIRRPLPKTMEPTSVEGKEGDGARSEANVVQADVLVATYPCAPALFGPTHISKLLLTNGVFVEQTILGPNVDDEFGCSSLDDPVPTVTTVGDQEPRNAQGSDIPQNDESQDFAVPTEDEETLAEEEEKGSSCENRIIQLVQRGQCSFFFKAATQKTAVNAEGLIVINSDDEELFVMSNGADEGSDISEEELPAAVLVTGLDGEDLLQLIEEESLDAVSNPSHESYLVAQIAVLKQETVADEQGSMISPTGAEVDWPIVRGSEDALQILARGGWGIHAVRKDGGSIRQASGNNDLQMFLLRHSDNNDANPDTESD
jgi:hypothetical protein